MALTKTDAPPAQQPYAPQQKPVAAAAAVPRKARQGSATPRRNLTYKEKLLIIQKKDQEPSWTQENLALWSREHFKLATKPTQATISNILRTRDKLQTTNVPPGFRSARPVKHPALDLAVIQWVLAMLASNTPLTRDAIQQRAITLAEEMDITTGITFSKGWVSSFMKRHQLHFRRKSGGDASTDADLQVVHQSLEPASIDVDASIAAPAAASNAGGAAQQANAKRKRSPVSDTTNKSGAQPQQPQVVALAPASLDVSSSPDHEASVVQWLTVPGNYLRWRKTAADATATKEPLVGEINALLRVRNQRELATIEVSTKIAALVDSFKAANSWLKKSRLQEVFNLERAAGGNEVKPHVLKLCKHYEALAPVLSAYVGNDDKEDASAKAAAEQQQMQQQQQLQLQQQQQQQHQLQQQLIQQQVVLQQQQQQVQQQQAQQEQLLSPSQQKKQRRMSRTPDTSVTSDKEEQQQQQLFDLECQKLQVDIQAKQVQLMVEKTLARKKLLDAGIPLAEVDKIFPM